MPFNSRRLTILIFMICWMAFHFWVFSRWLNVSSSLSLWDSVLSTILLAGVSAAISSGLLNYLSFSDKFWYVVTVSFFLALISLWLTTQGLSQVGASDAEYMKLLNVSQPIRFAFYFIVIAGICASTLFYTRFRDQQEMSQREAANASMVREAELQKLQLQLQPHFLFNSLNSINALILARPDEAQKMVLSLSDFLRITIKRADEHWITLAEEWNYLQLYLEIEKVRFGHRLIVETTFQEGSFDWKIPTLLLQPIVENAIKFGLYGTTGKVSIKLDAMINENILELSVTNPFDKEAQPSKGSGFGLSGIKRRLYLLYARNDLLETQVDENLFSVKLKIPKVA